MDDAKEEEEEEKEEGVQEEQLRNREQRLIDRLRLAVIATAEAEAQKQGLSVSPPVMTALADLTFNYTVQLAKDVEMFAQHAGRKSVNVDDVSLAARRNDSVAALLKSFAEELSKSKEQRQEKKRKKSAGKAD
ncbi:hypothetical protein O6H91_Y129800 [Diphasiastrum complanatum]|nr:hypothetical protein O6H91_Y129800 [Diphasiastrum complanatum]